MERWAVVSALIALFVGVGSVCRAVDSNDVYVASYGSDANTGQRSSPFQTLSYALNRVDQGGSISFLDSNSFGQNTVNYSLTIDGSGVLLKLLPSTGAALNINAGNNGNATIRNVVINGSSLGRGIDVNNTQKGINIL